MKHKFIPPILSGLPIKNKCVKHFETFHFSRKTLQTPAYACRLCRHSGVVRAGGTAGKRRRHNPTVILLALAGQEALFKPELMVLLNPNH